MTPEILEIRNKAWDLAEQFKKERKEFTTWHQYLHSFEENFADLLLEYYRTTEGTKHD
jgi:hypothetical protein